MEYYSQRSEIGIYRFKRNKEPLWFSYMRVEKTMKESGFDIQRFNQGDISTGFVSVPSGLGGQTTVVGV